MTRVRGEIIPTTVEVQKVKKGVPTVIMVEGYRYVLKHENQYPGRGKK
ncbi:hypothetical protein [Bhargavaea ginsengi]